MGISLSHRRYEEIKRIIVDLFVKYDVTCVPVNGFELATKMGIKIIPYSAIPFSKRYLLFKKSEDGFCAEKTLGEWYIYYNDEMDYGRINNTIMHEIGHIVLDHSDGQVVSNTLKITNGRQGFERIYYYDGKHYVLTGIGTNGFIVSAYPIEY